LAVFRAQFHFFVGHFMQPLDGVFTAQVGHHYIHVFGYKRPDLSPIRSDFVDASIDHGVAPAFDCKCGGRCINQILVEIQMTRRHSLPPDLGSRLEFSLWPLGFLRHLAKLRKQIRTWVRCSKMVRHHDFCLLINVTLFNFSTAANSYRCFLASGRWPAWSQNRIVVAKVETVSTVGHGNNFDSLLSMSCLPQFVLI
jgi:hypothetical protein